MSLPVESAGYRDQSILTFQASDDDTFDKVSQGNKEDEYCWNHAEQRGPHQRLKVCRELGLRVSAISARLELPGQVMICKGRS